MHASAFDRYQARSSPIHQLDPRLKVVVTVLFILSNVLLPDGAWLGFLLSFMAVMAVTRLARLPWDFALKRSLIAIPFALAAVTVIFTVPGQPLAEINLGRWTMVPTDAGLIWFVSIVIRSLLSVQMAILLTATTQFPDLIHALRHLHVPQPLVSTIAFMYRYLFVLADEAIRLMRARQARSASLPGNRSGGSVVWRAKVAGSMVGQLFLRSFDRGDRVYNAMLSRGYTGHLYTLNPHAMSQGDWNALILSLAYLVLIQVLARFALL